MNMLLAIGVCPSSLCFPWEGTSVSKTLNFKYNLSKQEEWWAQYTIMYFFLRSLIKNGAFWQQAISSVNVDDLKLLLQGRL